ncbi:unnamed protein product [Brachionus calyciflorus]|uniref:palmitoyl-protein hydrolase n=1 Tax=Brachionus calyciflorus TaxID=104777 RepID=A0A813ZG88_9BILA|nr:unnamed protein product [Brachionus calyciflorus]
MGNFLLGKTWRKSNKSIDYEEDTFSNSSNLNTNDLTTTTSLSVNANAKSKKSLTNKKSHEYNSSKTMSVILKPTAKQTATVIFLHGLGDTGHGWSSVFSEFKRPHIKYIFPTAPIRPVTLNGGFEMNAWFDILGLRPDATQDEVGIQKSSQLLLNIVDEEIKNGIPSDRIFIGGFSQGGATALYTSLTSSHRFAGVIALSTWLPLHHRFPAQLKECENKLTTPFIQCHGDVDPMVPLQWSEMTVKLLKTIGFSNVNFKTYRGMSHSSSPEELDDVSDFINKIAPA